MFPLWTFDQLEQLNRLNLKRRALDLHELAGPELSPQLHTGTGMQLVLWIIDLQCALVSAMGAPLTPADFGVPDAAGRGEGVKFPEQLPIGHPMHDRKPFQQWEQNATTQENEFHHDRSFTQAAVQSRIENDANRKMHRGTLDEFLFSGGEAIEPKDPTYKTVPPFQTDPRYGRRPNTATGKASVQQTSFAVPPPEAYQKESPYWNGEYIGSINSDVAPALPPLKR